MSPLVLIIISLLRIGFLSETEDAWSNRFEKTIRQTLYKMNRFRILRKENIVAVKDSSEHFIVKYLDLDYFVVGNLEGVESDIKVYPDITDTLHGGYRRIAVAEIYYEIKIYERTRKEPEWRRFVGLAELEYGDIEDAEENAFKDIVFKIRDYLKRYFVLRGQVVEKEKRYLRIDLGRSDGIRPGMTFLTRGKKGGGYFKIIEVDDSSKGYIFKGVDRIREGDEIRECPHGVHFIYLTLGYTRYRAEVNDTIRYPYGVFSSMKIGRRFQFCFDGGLGFGHIFFPSIGFSFTPLFYLGENFASGPTLGGEMLFAFQRWESDNGGEVLGDTSGIAIGFGLVGTVGATIRYDYSRFHINLEGYYPLSYKIDDWNHSRTENGEGRWERVPDRYLMHPHFQIKDLIIRLGLGYNFEIY